MIRMAPPLLILALSIIFLVWSYSYDEQGRLVPALVGWVLIFLASLDVIVATGSRPGQIINEFFTGQIIGEAPAGSDGFTFTKSLIAVLWVCAFIIGVYFFGFFLVIPVYIFLFVVFQGRKSLKTGIWASVLNTLFIYVVFEILMQYEIYQGMLFESLS
jgi:hypothetical protein